jgi:hypothetical protein
MSRCLAWLSQTTSGAFCLGVLLVGIIAGTTYLIRSF